MTSLRRSVLFERGSKVESREINQCSLSENSANQSGIFPAPPASPAPPAPRVDFLSPDFMEWFVQSTILSRL